MYILNSAACSCNCELSFKVNLMFRDCYAGESELVSSQSTPKGSVSSKVSGELEIWEYSNLQKYVFFKCFIKVKTPEQVVMHI